MSILDDLLGGSNDSTEISSNSSEFSGVIGTNPGLGLGLSDVLKFSDSSSDGEDMDSTSFTGIGDLGLGLSAPTLIGVSGSSDNVSASETDGGGGLLGGLL